MKPLELVIHPPLEPVVKNYALSCLAMGEQPKMHDPGEFGFGTSKRLTDAELAADYQFSRLDSRVRMARVENYSGDKVLFDHYERGLDQEATFERFATHPHYDEADS